MSDTKNSIERSNLLACLIVGLALIGFPLSLFGLPGIPFLGLKPDPMSGAGGYEPFAMELTLMMQTRGNEFIAMRITPEAWAKVGGRGAEARMFARALTGAPKLPPDQWAWILSEDLNQPGSGLATELGVPKDVSSVALSLKSHTPGSSDTWLLEPTK